MIAAATTDHAPRFTDGADSITATAHAAPLTAGAPSGITRPAALLGWYCGDGGRALFAPDGQLVCYGGEVRTLCRLLNIRRLARLRAQRAVATRDYEGLFGPTPRASRA